MGIALLRGRRQPLAWPWGNTNDAFLGGKRQPCGQHSGPAVGPGFTAFQAESDNELMFETGLSE